MEINFVKRDEEEEEERHPKGGVFRRLEIEEEEKVDHEEVKIR